ncbi:50S ribosomal protein L3 [Candidatus Roizmanbacteria bacterium]|nr:MAG: 50S ribosomal protein L3 [Candidatus Roizmanbacteria bacterium]
MAGFILGEKNSQSQMFTPEGVMVPVTVINTSPCFVVGIFTPEQDGYAAIKLGFGTRKNIAKPVEGQLKKAGIKTPLRFLKEIRVDLDKKAVTFVEEEGKKGVQISEQKLFIGDEVKPEVIFTVGDIVDISGTSKGKGFQGVVRRHNFRGGPKTHGQSDRLRAPGSVGSTTTPGRVFKGQRMAGQMGGDRITVQNLQVLAVSENSITVKGLIPGNTGSVVEVKTKDIS